jgi:hypothetical protein
MEVSCQPHAPATLLRGKEALNTPWVRAWVGGRAGLDVVRKR